MYVSLNKEGGGLSRVTWREAMIPDSAEVSSRIYIVAQAVYSPASRIPWTSSTADRSARNGHKSVNSVSCGSLNHEETGTALFGWNMYDAGELSRIIVSAIGLPSCDKS